MKTTKILLILAILIIAGVIYSFLQFPHKISVCATDVFYMQEDFDTVRKTIVRTESMSKLTELTGGQIISQKWDTASLRTDRLAFNSNWVIDAGGVLKIRANTFGDKIIDLRQSAHITPNYAIMKASMLYPVNELKRYHTLIYVRRWGDRTRVDIKIVADIEYKSPPIKNLHSKIDADITSEINKEAKDTSEAFKKVIKVYKGKGYNFKIPVRK